MTFAICIALLAFVASGEFSAAYSYVGPGIGISMLAALWGVIIAVVLAVGGIVLWPMRAFISRWRSAKTRARSEES